MHKSRNKLHATSLTLIIMKRSSFISFKWLHFVELSKIHLYGNVFPSFCPAEHTHCGREYISVIVETRERQPRLAIQVSTWKVAKVSALCFNQQHF